MAHVDDLLLPDYDQLALGDLQHRVRSLDQAQLQTLIDHERAHGDRVGVLQILQAHLAELEHGAEPSPGDPGRTPEVTGNKGGSPVQQSTSAEPNTPLRHGVAGQTPTRGRP
jgi:hypothetical protein